MDMIAKKFDLSMSSLENIKTHSHEVMAELIQLKDTYREQCQSFVAEIAVLNDKLIENSAYLA